jgi:hypothetical protein
MRRGDKMAEPSRLRAGSPAKRATLNLSCFRGHFGFHFILAIRAILRWNWPVSVAPNSGGSQQPRNPAAGNPAGMYLTIKLEEAELLLGYAAEVGIEVEDKIRADVLVARAATAGGAMPDPVAANVLAALTTLAVQVRPVTVQSLRSCSNLKEPRKTMRVYTVIALLCALPIVLFSLSAFVFDHFADKIKTETDTANALALKLQAELGPSSTNEPPPDALSGATNQSADQIWWGTNEAPHGLSDKDVINDLREFVATMREVDEYARLLNHFVFQAARDPYAQKRTDREAIKSKFELKAGLDVRLSREFAQKVEVYQEVRAFGDTVQETGSVYYGALATYILPVLYALLGASAYLLRLYEDQLKSRAYVSGDRHIARFLVAGIGGLVVGLFNTVTQGISMSPFALAFLVGYAVDVFFTFLEGLLQIFKRNPPNPGPPGKPPNPQS